MEWMPANATVTLNADDPRVAAMASVARCRLVRYGLGQDCDVRAGEIEDFGLAGFSFRLIAQGRSVIVRTPLIGRHNVHNCLAAAAVALAQGMSLTDIAGALTTASNPLRLKRLPGPAGSTLIDDTYNANPASMNAALDLLEVATSGRGRRIAVLGDMLELGNEEERLHRELGQRAAAAADLVILTGPRSRWTAEAAAHQGGARVCYVEEPQRLAGAVRSVVTSGDVVLLKASRGMMFERVVDALCSGDQ
ncbi:MAG: glutamate ligase domain-containing protein [Dehalococcoidia bacterium]